MTEMTAHEEARRSRVVHGWSFTATADRKSPHYSRAFVKHTLDYLDGKRDDPPPEYAQIDKVCK